MDHTRPTSFARATESRSRRVRISLSRNSGIAPPAITALPISGLGESRWYPTMSVPLTASLDSFREIGWHRQVLVHDFTVQFLSVPVAPPMAVEQTATDSKSSQVNPRISMS